MKKIELLSPAGNLEKLNCALHFGADAIYLAGKNYGLRAFADNFSLSELTSAAKLIHEKGKKMYVTLNIYAYDSDFVQLKEYIAELEKIGADAVIVSDIGIMQFIKKYSKLDIHLSTQANTTNKYSASFWADYGVKRIVTARELSCDQIAEMREYLPEETEIEAFVHGAMCVSYSGRCLLSNFFTSRASNRGECAQSCRWEYDLVEKSRGEALTVGEDGRGTYFLNSKDMNMISHIDKLYKAGVTSFKVEGRVKSSYYVASVTNAYRRAIDILENNPDSFSLPKELADELEKTGHRMYCTGFYLGDVKNNECYETSKPKQDYDFCALVLEKTKEGIWVEQRNRFKEGDVLEILARGISYNKTIKIGQMKNEQGETVSDALRVQEKLFIPCEIELEKNDILRKKCI